jgi:hypothetical protein
MNYMKWIIYLIAVLVGIILAVIIFKPYFERHARDGETIIAPVQ